jgi:V8-like Glu-specific endopeptidase
MARSDRWARVVKAMEVRLMLIASKGAIAATAVVGALLVVPTGAVARVGQHRPARMADPVLVFRQTDAQARAAEAFWTPRRMMEATPAGGTVDGPQPTAAAASVGQPARVGKIFYRIPFTGHLLSCTGTVVTSHSRDSILTAAHCLQQRLLNVPHQLLLFVPGYYRGQAPYGKWAVKSALVPGGWGFFENPSYDYGVMHVVSHNHIRIQSVVGADPYWTDAAQSGYATLIGYPTSDDWSAICGPTRLYAFPIPGHTTEYKFSCNGYSDGVSGSPLLIGPGNTAAGDGTVIGVLGGYQQGGDTASVSYANRLDSAFAAWWQKATY